MTCAFGTEACKHYYTVWYVRLLDLLLDLQAARDNGTFSTVLKKYTKPIVLIIDEWLLLKPAEAEARNLFESYIVWFKKIDMESVDPSKDLSMGEVYELDQQW